jgi:hypothetical protein
VRADHCQQNFDTEQNSDVGGNPTGVFIEAVDSPGMKELYRKSAKQSTEHNDAVRSRRQESVQTAQKMKRAVPMSGF